MSVDGWARQMDRRTNSSIYIVVVSIIRLTHIAFGSYILHTSPYRDYPQMWVYALTSIVYSGLEIWSFVHRWLTGVNVQYVCGKCCVSMGLFIWGAILLSYEHNNTNNLMIFFIVSFVFAILDVVICCGSQVIENLHLHSQSQQQQQHTTPPPIANMLPTPRPIQPQFSDAAGVGAVPVGVVVQC